MKGLSTIRNSALAFGLALLVSCAATPTAPPAPATRATYLNLKTVRELNDSRVAPRMAFERGESIGAQAGGTALDMRIVRLEVRKNDGTVVYKGNGSLLPEGKRRNWAVGSTLQPGAYLAVLVVDGDDVRSQKFIVAR